MKRMTQDNNILTDAPDDSKYIRVPIDQYHDVINENRRLRDQRDLLGVVMILLALSGFVVVLLQA